MDEAVGAERVTRLPPEGENHSHGSLPTSGKGLSKVTNGHMPWIPDVAAEL